MNTPRVTPALVTTPRLVRILGSEFASNDEGDLTPDDVDAEVRRIEADVERDRLKTSGALEQRRIDRAHVVDLQRLRREGLL